MPWPEHAPRGLDIHVGVTERLSPMQTAEDVQDGFRAW